MKIMRHGFLRREWMTIAAVAAVAVILALPRIWPHRASTKPQAQRREVATNHQPTTANQKPTSAPRSDQGAALALTESPPLPDVAPSSTPKPAPMRRRAVASAPQVDVPVYRSGLAVPIMYPLDRYRVNLMLVTLPIDQRAWNQLAPVIGAESGSFPVRLWRLRDGVATFVATIRVPDGPLQMTQVALPAADFARGDVAILEYSPGLFADAMQASVIDNKSGDPTRQPFLRTLLAYTTFQGGVR